MIHKIKALIRRMRFYIPLGITWHEYDDPKAVGGYEGWYEAYGRCLVFRKIGGKLQFRW